MRGAVASEYVETEVHGGIPPHRVSMVGIALGVVPLDEQSGTLQPVVVRLSWGCWSRPGKVHGIEGRLVVIAVQRGQPGRSSVEVGAEECPQCLALLGIELGRRYALGVDRVRHRVVVGVAQSRSRHR